MGKKMVLEVMPGRKKGFEIERIEPVGQNDSRGSTFEWKFNDGRQITVFQRKKGSQFGGHYHKGEDPSKNPERLFVVQGRIRAVFFIQECLLPRKIKREEVILETGDSFIIWPNTPHFFEVLEAVILVEYRITHFDKKHSETFPVELSELVDIKF